MNFSIFFSLNFFFLITIVPEYCDLTRWQFIVNGNGSMRKKCFRLRLLSRELSNYIHVWKVLIWSFIMSTTSLCNACKKSVSNRNALTCSLCQQDVHPKCNDLNYVDSQMIKNLNKLWYCLNCCQEVFPFTSINTGCPKIKEDLFEIIKHSFPFCIFSCWSTRW